MCHKSGDDECSRCKYFRWVHGDKKAGGPYREDVCDEFCEPLSHSKEALIRAYVQCDDMAFNRALNEAFPELKTEAERAL